MNPLILEKYSIKMIAHFVLLNIFAFLYVNIIECFGILIYVITLMIIYYGKIEEKELPEENIFIMFVGLMSGLFITYARLNYLGI